MGRAEQRGVVKGKIQVVSFQRDDGGLGCSTECHRYHGNATHAAQIGYKAHDRSLPYLLMGAGGGESRGLAPRAASPSLHGIHTGPVRSEEHTSELQSRG